MERKNVPIHLVFGEHRNPINIAQVETIAREALEQHPISSVGIFLEAAHFTSAQADFFQNQIQKGALPSESFMSLLLTRHPKQLRWAFYYMYKLDSFLNSDNIFWREARSLDALTRAD